MKNIFVSLFLIFLGLNVMYKGHDIVGPSLWGYGLGMLYGNLFPKEKFKIYDFFYLIFIISIIIIGIWFSKYEY